MENECSIRSALAAVAVVGMGAWLYQPQHGLAITELSTHLQGQLVAVNPVYDAAFDGFADPSVRGSLPLAAAMNRFTVACDV